MRSSHVAERQAGSNRGRPSIDWEEAFLFYASLDDTERSYRAVANHFGVSVRTVETHGRKERWRERLARIKAEAAESAAQRVAAERAEKLAQLELLIEATFTTYAHQLRAGSVKISAADLTRMVKLREELWAQEVVDRAARAGAEASEHELDDPEQRKRDLIAALDEAGAFERLRNLIDDPPASPRDAGEETEAA